MNCFYSCFMSSVFVMVVSTACAKTDGAPKPEPALSKRIAQMMVKVDGGTFVMGQTISGFDADGNPITKAESTSTDNNDPRPDELPLHNVTLSDFEIGRYEVTQGLWREVMGTLEPCYSASLYGGDDDRAMDGVGWDDALSFIVRLNELTGDKYRLPTEAEWEYAARGGKQSRDYRYSGSNIIGDVGWFKESSVECVQRVGQKAPNELGLYDMSGNCFEWCYDWYSPYSAAEQINPKGVDDKDKYYTCNGASVCSHVLRGGHWQSSAFGLRVSFRTKIPTTSYKPRTGFRIARGISYDQMNYYSSESGNDDIHTVKFSKESGSFAAKTIAYRKAVINPVDGQLPALCLYLHGGSSRGSDNETQLAETAVSVIADYIKAKGISAIFIVPQCEAGGAWTSIRQPLKAMLDSFIATNQGDASRVYCFGGSMGGTGTWDLVSYCTSFFAAAMPVAGSPRGCNVANVSTTPIYTVMGTADNIMSIAAVETFLASLKAVGGSYRLDIEHGWSHQNTCTMSYTDARLDWVFDQSRKQTAW